MDHWSARTVLTKEEGEEVEGTEGERQGMEVDEVAERPQRRTEAVMRMQQEVQIKESRWMEATPERWKQPKGEDRTEMKKEARR